MDDNFKNGSAVLSCGFSCSEAYIWKRDNISSLEESKNWQGLADEVMVIGARLDISYFYLGLAAENLGYYQAADRYYVYSLNLTLHRETEPYDTTCREISPAMCNGIDVPRVAFSHLQAIRQEEVALAASSRRPAPGSPSYSQSPGNVRIIQRPDDIETLDPPPAVN